ncbi:SGNH/GDSL hydrolase family protein [Actinophytocola oryzae]|uniref:GDSL-like lipase/acylhydrolase family protein n=1 Tax=Actinophytocola oryzae TaxID=502181 RepID=A0A4V3FR12_9PSEU|nr:SGNH/GDSL hydrolase family protein [Actinophytocola oryzae]TDV41831.1 GDSL-like lipase/acylhydrolase family protein [Actinophytocola oryzae]
MKTARLSLLIALFATFLVTGTANAAAPRYVALGDSAASGPLIPAPDLTAVGCFRSTNNYPKLVARQLGVPITDVTCSGADTGDMTASQSTDFGDVPPQLDALGADTTLVTLQIGGNDAGLVGLAESCLNLLPEIFGGTSCKDTNTAGGGDVYGDRVNGVGPKVGSVLDGIHERAPGARVFVVGYTTYLPPGGCYPRVQVWPRDADYVQAKIDQLNQVLADAAAAHGATYVDIRTPGIGKDVCKSSLVRWTEPFIPANIAAPLHPNATGMAGMATVVAAAVA